MKSKYSILGIIILVAVVIVGLTQYSSEKTMAADKAIKSEVVLPPNIELYDQDGNLHKLSDYKGKVVFINFWATWCKYCVNEIPDIEELYKQYGSNKKDVIFLGLVAPRSEEKPGNIDVDKESIKKVMRNLNMTYPVLFDNTGKYFQSYGIRFFPVTFIIGKDGAVFKEVGGAMPKETMNNLIKEALKQ